MNVQTPMRNHLAIAVLLLALLCTACGAGGSAPTSQKSLSTLLAAIPQDPIDQADGFIYYVDYPAMEKAYDAARPSNADELANYRDSDEAHKIWQLAWQQTYGLLQVPPSEIENMPEKVGFSALDVDQAIHFGVAPSTGLILAGDFDEQAIRSAYQANLGMASSDLNGKTAWCVAEGCAAGTKPDPQYRMRANPFGGSIGQRQPMNIGDDLLMASADPDLVVGHLDALARKQPSLADEPAYQAAIKAVSKDAAVIQAMIANPAVAQRLADQPPVNDRLPPNRQRAAREALLENYQDLPPYELLILADAVTADEQIARLGLVYKDAATAESAAAILEERLEGHASQLYRGQTFAELLALRHVTGPRHYVHQEAGQAVLVLEYPTPKAPPDELVQMLKPGYQGSFTPPGMVFRLFDGMFTANDTSWLSAVTRASLEAIQVGTLVGLQVNMGLSDLMDGEIDQANFGGIVYVELEDGRQVDAIWDRKLGDQFVGGMKLEVAPTSDPDYWKVLSIVEMP